MMRSILQSGSTRVALCRTQAYASTSATKLVASQPAVAKRGLALIASSSSVHPSSLASTSSTFLHIHSQSSHPTVYASQTRSASTLLRKPEEPEEPEVYRDGEPTIIAPTGVAQLQKVAESGEQSITSLRVAVEPGGCHGYQYKMEITEEVEEDDFQFEVHPGVSILVDSVSLALVRGSTIDYVTELIGSQFAIKTIRRPRAPAVVAESVGARHLTGTSLSYDTFTYHGHLL